MMNCPNPVQKLLWLSLGPLTTRPGSRPPSQEQDPNELTSAFLFEDDVLPNYRIVFLEFDSFATIGFVFPRRVRIASVGSRLKLDNGSLVTFCHQIFSPVYCPNGAQAEVQMP
mgnify:CR=1 FL=1